ncbi:MAG: hypothetical protein EON60_14120, partial [Alphaproteobacteria bacterium]
MKPTGLILGLAVMAAFGVASAYAQEEPYCREYQRKVTVGGRLVDSYGTACMQPDGSWKLDSGDVVNNISEPVYDAPVQMLYSEPVFEQRPLYYGEPVYTTYRYYSGPVWGLNLGWSDRDRWNHRGGRGHNWHDGRGHGGRG